MRTPPASVLAAIDVADATVYSAITQNQGRKGVGVERQPASWMSAAPKCTPMPPTMYLIPRFRPISAWPCTARSRHANATRPKDVGAPVEVDRVEGLVNRFAWSTRGQPLRQVMQKRLHGMAPPSHGCELHTLIHATRPDAPTSPHTVVEPPTMFLKVMSPADFRKIRKRDARTDSISVLHVLTSAFRSKWEGEIHESVDESARRLHWDDSTVDSIRGSTRRSIARKFCQLLAIKTNIMAPRTSPCVPLNTSTGLAWWPEEGQQVTSPGTQHGPES